MHEDARRPYLFAVRLLSELLAKPRLGGRRGRARLSACRGETKVRFRSMTRSTAAGCLRPGSPAPRPTTVGVDRFASPHEPRRRLLRRETTTPRTRNNTQANDDGPNCLVAFVLLVELESRRRRPVSSSAASSSFGVELVFLALVDSVGAVTSAVGGGVTEAECVDDNGNDPEGVNGEADQPENQCGAQDDQHHLAEARPLAKQE